MRHILFTTFSVGILALTLLFPWSMNFIGATAHAADTTSYTPLVPIPQLASDPAKCKNDPTGVGNCDIKLTDYIPGVVKLIIGIAGALAVIMIIIGGVQYLSTDAMQGKEDGKNKIQNAIYGLLLAIGAFVILNTINPNTLKLNLNLTVPSTGTAATTPPCIPPQIRVSPGSPCITQTRPTDATAWPGAWSGTTISDTNDDRAERTLLGTLPVKVSVSDGNCTFIGQTGCTSLDGLSKMAQDGLAALSERAKVANTGAVIQINGGTEYWLHCVDVNRQIFAKLCPDVNSTYTVHKPGLGGIDLQTNTELNKIITSQGTVAPAKNNGCENSSLGVYVLDRATYVKEDAGHWHVCYGGP